MTSTIDFTSQDLRRLRYRLGWSQAEMARCLKLDLSFISGIEAGQTTLPAELKSSLVRIMHQADSNAAQMQRTPIAELIMKEKNLSQIHSFDCDFEVTTPGVQTPRGRA